MKLRLAASLKERRKGFGTGPARRAFTPNCPRRFGMGWMPVAYPWEIKQTLRAPKKRPQSKPLEITERRHLVELAKLRTECMNTVDLQKQLSAKPCTHRQDRQSPSSGELWVPRPKKEVVES